MKARRKTWLNSGSVCTRLRTRSAGTSSMRPATRARARTTDRHDRIPLGQNLDFAFEDQHERAVRLALFPQDLAFAEDSFAPERRDSLDLGRRQDRKDLVLGDARRGGFGAHRSDPIRAGPTSDAARAR